MAGWNSRDPLKASSKASLPKEPAKSKDLAPGWRSCSSSLGGWEVGNRFWLWRFYEAKWTKNDSDVAYILKKHIVWEWWTTWFWMCASSISRKCQSSHRAKAAKTCKTMQCLLILFAGTESIKERTGDNRFSRFADFATLDDFSRPSTKSVRILLDGKTKILSRMRNTHPKTTMETNNTFEKGETSTGFRVHPQNSKPISPGPFHFSHCK